MEFLKYSTSFPINLRCLGRVKVVDEPDEAKHYKTAASAKRIMSTIKNRGIKDIANYKDSIEQSKKEREEQAAKTTPDTILNTTGVPNTIQKFVARHFVRRQLGYRYYDQDHYQTKVDETQKGLDFLDTVTVIEVEVKNPNFLKDESKGRRFEEHGVGFKVRTSGGGNHCRCCGMYLNQLPMVMFGLRNPGKVCPWCVEERAHEARKLIEDMDPTERESAEADRFLHQMG